MKKVLCMLLALAMLLSAAGVMAEEAAAKDILVLFTSDVHCGVEQGFGYQGLAIIRNQLAKDNAVILVDNGDAIQGEPVGTMTKGSAIVDIMNAVGYAVAIPGNHEFDYGMENFLDLAKNKAEYPYISCNFTYKGELVFQPYIIKEVGGKKIAFVGVTTPRTFVTSTPTYFQEDGVYVYGFCEGDGTALYAAVQKAADDARAEGADYVVVMAHLGNEAESSPYTSFDVIGHTNGIDALLDGHEHAVEPNLMVKNKDGVSIPFAACGTKLSYIGYLRIAADGKLSTGLYDAKDYQAPDVTEAIAAATDALNVKLAEVVAHTDYDLTINDPESGKRIIRIMETNLGDLCADAYRSQAGDVDIALVNGGGIRVTIPAGDITLNDILRVHPFGNALCVVKATGQQVLDALEWTSRNVPEENGGFLHVSGLTYEIHTYLPSTCTQDDKGSFTGVTGEYRVKNVLVNGEPLDLEKEYTVASHNYMLKDGGDGTCMFQSCEILQDSVKLDNQVLIDYIVDVLDGNVGEMYSDPLGQGRIVWVQEAPAE